MNQQITQALTVKKREHRRMAVAAHEIGHALAERAYGMRPDYVRLNFGMLGGFRGGICEWDEPAADWTPEQKTGRLISLMAGHAAETRFCRLYLGLDDNAAYNYGREWAFGDYDAFRRYRSKFGIRTINTNWAFRRATRMLERQASRLDRLTLCLERGRYLSGGAL